MSEDVNRKSSFLGTYDGRCSTCIRNRVRPRSVLSESGLEPRKLYRRGESVSAKKPEGRKHKGSGINIVVSEADFNEFPRQVDEATAFLEAHKEELLRLRCFPGIEAMTIDFGIARRDVIVQCDFLPPPLIRSGWRTWSWDRIVSIPCG